MAKKTAPKEAVTVPAPEPKKQARVTVDSLFQFLEAGGAQKAQIIRVTGTGRMDAAINPQRTGNILLLIEVDPNAGGIVV
jgi:hypothetical protein